MLLSKIKENVRERVDIFLSGIDRLRKMFPLYTKYLEEKEK